MNMLEIREAAASASMRIGQERIDFIQGSYPKQYWQAIKELAEMLDDAANNAYESGRVEPCIYNRGFYGVY